MATHKKVSAKADGGDATLVRPSDWNDEHDFLSPLEIDGTNGGNTAATLPHGAAGSQDPTGITLISGPYVDDPTHDDLSGNVDITGRINRYAYQRASFNSFGEIDRTFLMRKDAKGMFAYYAPVDGYDGSRNADETGGWTPVAWHGAHVESNSHTGNHNHWSIEVPDSTGALQTRFEIRFSDAADNDNWGLDLTQILTDSADFVVRQGSGEEFILSGNGVEKGITFSNDTGPTERRWKIRSNSTAESGSNVGSDFQIVRYSDGDVAQDSPFEITRSTGQVIIGSSTGNSAGLLVNRNSTSPVVKAASLATNGHSFQAQGTTTGAVAYESLVAADSINRFAMTVDGGMQWGDGSATRDTTLYRSAANVLKTDDALIVAGAFNSDLFVKKGSDETVTSDTAIQNDNELTLAVVANASYILETFIIFDGATAGDIKYGWAYPASATMEWTENAYSSSATGQSGTMKVNRLTIASEVSAGAQGAATWAVAQPRGLLITSGTAGNIVFKWAQNTSDGTATTVKAGSWMRLTRVA